MRANRRSPARTFRCSPTCRGDGARSIEADSTISVPGRIHKPHWNASTANGLSFWKAELPPTDDDGLRQGDCCNRFLTSKKHLLDTGEITLRTFQAYHRSFQHVIDVFGRERGVDDLRPADFDTLRATLAERRGPIALSNQIHNVRILFKYAYDAALIDRPLRFGPTFKQPSKRVLRKARQQNANGC